MLKNKSSYVLCFMFLLCSCGTQRSFIQPERKTSFSINGIITNKNSIFIDSVEVQLEAITYRYIAQEANERPDHFTWQTSGKITNRINPECLWVKSILNTDMPLYKVISKERVLMINKTYTDSMGQFTILVPEKIISHTQDYSGSSVPLYSFLRINFIKEGYVVISERGEKSLSIPVMPKCKEQMAMLSHIVMSKIDKN
jgi:hypothetical protein